MKEALITILDQLDAFVYVTDLETDEILFVNQKMQDIFGRDHNVVGRLCWETMQKGFTERCPFCQIHRLIDAPDTPVVWESRNTLNRRYYKNTDSVIEWINGKKAHLQFSIDITDIKASQREADRSIEILKNILNGMSAYIYVSDMATDEILFINKSMREVFGLGEDVVGQTCWKVLQSGFTERCSFCPNFKLEVDPLQEVVWEEHNTVTHRHYKNVDSVIAWTDGRLVHMQHSTDVTDLKNAIEEAENASRSKSQFLSNMSHEIRTPMNAIIGMTEILLNDKLTERQRHYLNDIKISGTSLLGIINDILDFSKIEAGKLSLIPIDYSLVELIDNLDSMFTFAAEKKNLYFYLDIQSKLPDHLFGDDIRLRQALVNVIGNAIKFTKEGGVTLAVHAEDDRLFFDVADTGIGIKEEELHSIFEEFGQLDARNNRNIAGTGLGLSITYSLIRLMQGRIWVESVYGQGTTFHLEIPLIPGDAQKARDNKTRSFDSIEAPTAKVLVVDDNEVNLDVASGLMEMASITCDTALSGWEAIRKIDSEGNQYDVVFMDHMMPEMDGVETTRLLRETHSPDDLVIIALTANAVGGTKEMLMAAGMNDFLSKPIDNKYLTHILRKWLPPEKVHLKAAGATTPAADKPKPPLIGRIEKIPGLEVQSALDRMGGMHDAYAKTLGIFVRRLPETLRRLTSFLADGDSKGFAIEVHGLKGSLRSIGAAPLGDAAEELEFAAKENNTALCEEGLPDFIPAVQALGEKLAAAIAEPAAEKPAEPGGAKQGDPEELKHKLEEVQNLLDAFEADPAMEILTDLKGKNFGAEIKAGLTRVCEKVEEFDYDGAMALLQEMRG